MHSWYGVGVGHSGRVRILNLPENNLSGSLPPELGNLADLEGISLWGNDLSGPIPPELGDLTGLTEIYLSNNNLNGPIPSELGNLTNLKALDLWGNDLSGPIPPELDNLTNLVTLTLYRNQLVGPIPLGIIYELLDAGATDKGRIILADDRPALEALYDSTNGDSWEEKRELEKWRAIVILAWCDNGQIRTGDGSKPVRQ